METISTKGLLLRIFAPTAALSLSYLILGHFCVIPHILLFCILGTVILVPSELIVILKASRREDLGYSLKSAFAGQKKVPVWQIILFAAGLFGIVGLLTITAAPLENMMMSGLRRTVLDLLPQGFDWTDHEYLKASFSGPVLIVTCVYYGIFNVFLGPITEELFFRGYLTSHYKTQGMITPILITILFSLYHFWIPFNNIFRILAFTTAAIAAYKKQNIYISIVFHCFCNLISVISFSVSLLA